MREAKAWQLVLDVTFLRVVVLGVSNFPRRWLMMLDLWLPGISRTSNVEEAMVERRPETSMATGDSRVIISLRCKISSNMPRSGISLKPKIPMAMVSSSGIECEGR